MVRGVALHMKRISDSLANFVRTTFQLFICKEQLFLRNLVFGSHQMVKSPLDFAKPERKLLGRGVGVEPCMHDIGHSCITGKEYTLERQ